MKRTSTETKGVQIQCRIGCHKAGIDRQRSDYLGSACPSMEMYHYAKNNKFNIVEKKMAS